MPGSPLTGREKTKVGGKNGGRQPKDVVGPHYRSVPMTKSLDRTTPALYDVWFTMTLTTFIILKCHLSEE